MALRNLSSPMKGKVTIAVKVEERSHCLQTTRVCLLASRCELPLFGAAAVQKGCHQDHLINVVCCSIMKHKAVLLSWVSARWVVSLTVGVSPFFLCISACQGSNSQELTVILAFVLITAKNIWVLDQTLINEEGLNPRENNQDIRGTIPLCFMM